MSEGKGWPDPAKPGIPENPTRQGPHVVVDPHGKRWWAWWRPDSTRHGGSWTYGVAQDALLDWTYIGPGKPPDGEPV